MALTEAASPKMSEWSTREQWQEGQWSSDRVMDEEKALHSDHFDNRESQSAGHQQKMMLI